MTFRPELDAASDTPIYRQLGEYVRAAILRGELKTGDRLPPTRELAGQLGLNRTTVSAAYEWLETEGLLQGAVGRGSFVSGTPQTATPVNHSEIDWARVLTPRLSPSGSSPAANVIDFSSSRPSGDLFPLEEFRKSCDEVLNDDKLRTLLQIGSPLGYGPLRAWLLDRAKTAGIARDTDDILITNGCQQAVDILRRALIGTTAAGAPGATAAGAPGATAAGAPGTTAAGVPGATAGAGPGAKVAIEEPVYPGLRNLFADSGADLIGIPVTEDGMDLNALRRALSAGAKLVVVTPSFQNPTGAALPAAARPALVSMAKTAGAVIIENDIYSGLVYEGESLPRLKSFDSDVILLGSFSKIAFPGVRVGWIVAPKPVIARAAELKQLTDLHTDQLSQAFLLQFAKSGRLARHEAAAIEAGRKKLRAVKEASAKHLSNCTYSLPDGGMNLWIDLPAGLDAGALRELARQAGVDYLPGRYFSVSRSLDSGLRLSFAGLTPDEIRRGIEILGGVIRNATTSRDDASRPTLAFV